MVLPYWNVIKKNKPKNRMVLVWISDGHHPYYCALGQVLRFQEDTRFPTSMTAVKQQLCEVLLRPPLFSQVPFPHPSLTDDAVCQEATTPTTWLPQFSSWFHFSKLVRFVSYGHTWLLYTFRFPPDYRSPNSFAPSEPSPPWTQTTQCCLWRLSGVLVFETGIKNTI